MEVLEVPKGRVSAKAFAAFLGDQGGSDSD